MSHDKRVRGLLKRFINCITQSRRGSDMTTAHILGNLFPDASDIPEKYRLDGQTEQREYLVDGELKTWSGPLAQVRSGP